MRIAIAIPARYGSTRFPGKPLAEIGGQSMLSRVVDLAKDVIGEVADDTQSDDLDISYFVTTEDQRIAEHATEIGAPCVMTGECETGSDRVLAALQVRAESGEAMPDFVLNLQGDAPFTPKSVVRAIIDAFRDDPKAEVVTPVHALSWDDLDRLRAAKESTPFSGTTAIVGADGKALWFSKNIIPGIRKEEALRAAGDISPVHQHIGLYGFRVDVLERFCALPMGGYERLEGLEQLRLLENGISVSAVKVGIDKGEIQSGVDTPEDLVRANAAIARRG